MPAFGKFIVCRRGFLIIPIIFAGVILFFSLSTGYSSQPTHSLLAQRSAQIYSQFYSHLSDEEIYWISEGAIKEDTPPRWINHFFDPTTGMGWNGEREGDLPPEVVKIFAEVGLSTADALSSINWAHNQELQEKYSLYEGNRTFEKAIFDYVMDNKKEAYKSLGHILHLIEDASVPAHTRQDTHFDAFGDPGEPYEKWTSQNTDLSLLDNLNPDQENFFCVNLDDCFNKVAGYSNGNFFSEGTIFDSAYSKPLAAGYLDIDRYTKYVLAVDGTILAKMTISPLDKKVISTVDDDKINQGYWRLLSKEAVLAGVETIKIFQAEAAKAQADKSLLKPPPKYNSSVFMWLLTGPLNGLALSGPVLIPVVSPYGELVKIWDDISPFLKSSYNDVAEFVSDIPSKFSGLFMATPPFAGSGEPVNNSQENNTSSPAPPEENNSSAANSGTEESSGLPQISETTGSPIDNNSADEDVVSDSGIGEEILKPEKPSEITEEKLSPLIPEQLTPEAPIPEITSGMGGGPLDEEDENATSSEPIATSTPGALPLVAISFSGYKLTSRQFMVGWTSSSSDVSLYDVQEKHDLLGWQNLVSSTTATSTIFSVPQDLTTYYFRARAFNGSSTPGAWQEILASIDFYPVAINEIAWAGTGTSSKARNDEWIELYNKTAQSIDFSGWSIVSVDSATTTVVALKNSVASSSFYLIERGDDETVSDVVGDLVAPFGGNGLSNSGEKLALIDSAGQIVDLIDFSDGWPAGTASPDYKTMERVNPYLGFDVPGNWQSNNGIIRNGLNVDGQLLNGTPKAPNSAFSIDFFYLYPAKNTTATSTALEWTRSYLLNFKNYKIIRSYDSMFGATTTVVVATVVINNFVDDLLKPETEYFYKILSCNNLNECVESNVISIETPEFIIAWQAPEEISQNISSDGGFLDMAINSASQPVIVWNNFDSTGGNSINFSQKQADSDWSQIEILTEDFNPFGRPQIKTKNQRTEIIFNNQTQNQDGELLSEIFNWQRENGIWQAPENILADDAFSPSAVIDQQGITHIIWVGDTASSSAILYRSLAADGSFLGEIEEISESAQGKMPKIIMDSHNKLHAVWFFCPEGEIECSSILYSSNSRDGAGWGNPIKIAETKKPVATLDQPELTIDKNSNILIAWEQSGEIYLLKSDLASTTEVKIISQSGESLNLPQMVFDFWGELYLFYTGSINQTGSIYFISQKENGQWQPVKKAFDFDYKILDLKIAIGLRNTLHLAWLGGENNYQVFYSYAGLYYRRLIPYWSEG